MSGLQDGINHVQELTRQCVNSVTEDAGSETFFAAIWAMLQDALRAKEHACLVLQEWILQMKWLVLKGYHGCAREGIENISAETLVALIKSSQILTELVTEKLDSLTHVPSLLEEVEACVSVIIHQKPPVY